MPERKKDKSYIRKGNYREPGSAERSGSTFRSRGRMEAGIRQSVRDTEARTRNPQETRMRNPQEARTGSLPKDLPKASETPSVEATKKRVTAAQKAAKYRNANKRRNLRTRLLHDVRKPMQVGLGAGRTIQKGSAKIQKGTQSLRQMQNTVYGSDQKTDAADNMKQTATGSMQRTKQAAQTANRLGLKSAKRSLGTIREFKAKKAAGVEIRKALQLPENASRRQVRKALKDLNTQSRMLRTADRQRRRVERVARKTQRTAKGAAKAPKKVYQSLSTSQKAMRVVAQNTGRAARLMVRLVQGVFTAVKAIIHAVTAAAAAMGTVGWLVALLLVVVVFTTSLLASASSPFSSLFSFGDNDIALSDAMQELNQQFNDRLTEIQNTFPHDDLKIVGAQATWKPVLAIFAATVTYGAEDADAAEEADPDMDINIWYKGILEQIFWTFNQISYTTEEYEEAVPEEPEPGGEESGGEDSGDSEGDDSSGEPEEPETVMKTRLIITVTAVSVDEYGPQLGEEAMEMVYEMLSPEYDGIWADLLLGVDFDFAIDDNGFVWPVQGYTSISSGFGYRDWSISGGGEFHRGVDIPAPYGTPVHAAAGGTVVRSEYNSSWGNYVKIDHGGGVTTLYAHNSTLIATVGAVVEPGDVIALVGSTGDSTGNHCHLEFAINDVLQDPLNYIVPQ